MPEDEFDRLLEQCRNQLSNIELNVPSLDRLETQWPPAAPTPAPDAKTEPSRPALAPVLRPPLAPLPILTRLPRTLPPLSSIPTIETAPHDSAPRPKAAPPPPPRPTPAARIRPPLAPIPTAEPGPPAAPAQTAARPAPRLAPSKEPAEDEIFPPASSRSWPPPAPPTQQREKPARSSEESTRRRNAALAAAAVVAVGALGAWYERRPSDVSFEIDDVDALAVRPDKKDILAAKGKELIDMTLSGRLVQRLPLDEPVGSLRWDQGSLWSADGLKPSVVERSEGGRATVFPLNHVPAALFVRDKYLWTAEKGAHTIHQFLISRSILGAMLQPLDLYDLPGLTPETFALDDAGELWLVDGLSRRLYRLRSEGGRFKPVASAPLSPFVGPAGRIRALTIEGDAVWLLSVPASSARGVLRRIVLSRLDWTPS
jgi:hypothetical protein